MARHKNANWNLATPPGLDGAGVSVLMDIRDELQTLNRLLGCHNFVRIPSVLDQILTNTTRKPRAKRKR